MDAQATFNVVEATIADIHAAYLDGRLTARRLVETYYERIAAYDKAGPAINAVISTNPKALVVAATRAVSSPRVSTRTVRP